MLYALSFGKVRCDLRYSQFASKNLAFGTTAHTYTNLILPRNTHTTCRKSRRCRKVFQPACYALILVLLLTGCDPHEPVPVSAADSISPARECFDAGGTIYAEGNVGYINGCIKAIPADTASSIVIDSAGNPIGGSAGPR